MATEHNESSPDTADSGSDSVSYGPGPSPAKKKSRTTSSSNSTGNRHACFDHFNKLNEKYHTLNGNETTFWLCVCIHCDREFDEKVAAKPFQTHQAPKKMPRNARDCRNHLKKCEAFTRYNRMIAPPRAKAWTSTEESTETL